MSSFAVLLGAGIALGIILAVLFPGRVMWLVDQYKRLRTLILAGIGFIAITFLLSSGIAWMMVLGVVLLALVTADLAFDLGVVDAIQSRT